MREIQKESLRLKETKRNNNYLLDTSAILCLWLDEEGSNIVEGILRKSKNKVIVSFMTLMEGKYRLWKAEGKAKAEEFCRYLYLLPINRIGIDDSILNRAAEIKATNNLSVADSFIIATSIANDTILVHKDPEFEQVKDKITLLTLPYKTKKVKSLRIRNK